MSQSLTLSVALTLTFELDLGRVKMNQRAKCLGQRSFRWKVIDRKDTHTRLTARPVLLITIN